MAGALALSNRWPGYSQGKGSELRSRNPGATGLVRQIAIEGPVLLLMGPLGSFFARLASHLEGRGVPVFKLMLPLHEFGFPAHQRLPYDGPMEALAPFLKEVIARHGIRHLFMYGDFIDPHRIAIELVREHNANQPLARRLDAWVFELGYVRPNHVTLERERVNARSALHRPVAFYRSLPPVRVLPSLNRSAGVRWHKLWKAPTFVQHAFSNYRIISGPHKLQPRPSYLLAQLHGLLRKHQYRITERRLHRRLGDGTPYILVPLQVSSDSQVSLGSRFSGMEPFIEELIVSFARHGRPGDRLAFKHHPRDRGYNHYGALIRELSERHGLGDRVIYFHDGALGPILRASRAVVTINSTVGLQALYHGVATRVMGQAFYDLPGLTDQQPLESFWQEPRPPERDLFLRFQTHLINTTQINGNFDGRFPFAETFAVAPALEALAPGRPPGALQRLGRLALLSRGLLRYGLQLLALRLGARATARQLLEAAAAEVLQGLGVRVLVERRSDGPSGPAILIANHGHPLDVLVVQGHLHLRSLTTAARHLGWLLPWFQASAANYGHTNLDHLCPRSRRAGLHGLLGSLRRHGRVFLFPSGSLVTPISERVSPSLWLLARRCGAVILPLTFVYRGFQPAEQRLLYKPLRLILSRLGAPQATVICREGQAIDPSQFADGEALCRHIRELYGSPVPPGNVAA